MEKILLINSPNRYSEPPRHYPYGLGIIFSVLVSNNYDVEIFDGNFSSDFKLQKLLKEKHFDFIGISGLVTSYKYQKKIAKIVKQESPNSILASGGGLASAVSVELLEIIPQLDIIFIGEGEKSIIQYLTNFNNLENVQGIAYRQQNSIILNKPIELNECLDSIPLPSLDFLQLEKYFDNGSFPLTPSSEATNRRANILTSRGCPYNCDFCYNSLGRNKVRRRSASNVLDEIDILVNKYKIDFISFMDESFLMNKNLFEEIIEGILLRNYKFKWGIAARSTSVNKENLNLLKLAGCDFIYFGFDSGSESTLIQMNKKLTIEDNFNAFKLSVENNIYPVPNIIIGYDNETISNINENYDFFNYLIRYSKTIKNNRTKKVFEKGFNNFGAIYFATPYPESQLYERNKHKLPKMEDILEKISFKDAYELTFNVSKLCDQTLIHEQQKNDKIC